MDKRGFGHRPVSEFIRFVPTGTTPSGKTKYWRVVNTSKQDDEIGWVRWHGAWRKYVYECDHSFYDWECLRLIADFIEKVTLEHRNARKTSKDDSN